MYDFGIVMLKQNMVKKQNCVTWKISDDTYKDFP